MLPATFLVDHVRVYQDKNNSRQTLGCNPRDYPTKKYILGHEYRYMTANKARALEPVKVGGGKCRLDEDCRGPAGSSRSRAGSCSRYNGCSCSKDWTVP